MAKNCHGFFHHLDVSSVSCASDLLWRTTYSSGAVVTTRLYDDLDRLTNITTVANGVTVNSFSYTLDATGRRTRRHDADGARLDWDYDPFDQLTSAARTNSPNGAADAAYRYQYQYDLVGNRLREKRGPEADPLGRQLTLYGSHNNLNQLTTRDWSGKLPLHGAVADPDTILLVQGVTNAPPYWNGTNWLAGASLTSGSNNVDIVSVLGTGSNRTDLTLFMPPSKPQAFQYDLNGNLLNDGYRAYTWDGENRLVAIETTPAAIADGLPARRSEYLYDAQWRRIQRTDLSGWDGTAYAVTNQTRSVWDGMAILAEIKTTVDGVSTNYNVWGLDISQTLNGAGGVGGLLAIIKGGVGVPPAIALPCYDGNGNVTALLDDNGTVTARYEYTPFGQLFASSGPAAHDNPWRFSTKPYDDLWNLVLYEYRIYSPDLQVWLSRDPVCTITGYNLVLFLNNDSINSYDLFGLVEYCCSQHDIDIQAQSASHVVVRMTEKTIRYPEKDLPMHPEFGVYLCCSKDNVVYMAGLPTEGEFGMEEGGGWIAYLDFTKLRKCHDDDKVVAIVHSHPSGKNFSKADLLNPCIYMQAVGTTILWRHCDGQTCSKDLAQKDAQWECIGK